mmetsp:Transcript_60795/g.146316  ORF Transcript_60795/g.146316 Transcript_60795/m.146316 type:complete len:247 (+) Transcript_60795:480-1220(+)
MEQEAQLVRKAKLLGRLAVEHPRPEGLEVKHGVDPAVDPTVWYSVLQTAVRCLVEPPEVKALYPKLPKPDFLLAIVLGYPIPQLHPLLARPLRTELGAPPAFGVGGLPALVLQPVLHADGWRVLDVPDKVLLSDLRQDLGVNLLGRSRPPDRHHRPVAQQQRVVLGRGEVQSRQRGLEIEGNWRLWKHLKGHLGGDRRLVWVDGAHLRIGPDRYIPPHVPRNHHLPRRRHVHGRYVGGCEAVHRRQ